MSALSRVGPKLWWPQVEFELRSVGREKCMARAVLALSSVGTVLADSSGDTVLEVCKDLGLCRKMAAWLGPSEGPFTLTCIVAIRHFVTL